MNTNIYNMTIPIYENRIPKLFENVLVIFTEHKTTHIEGSLLEYDGINGMMVYEDATRKKKVYDWKKEIPLNKPTIARIEKIFDDNYVQLSTLYFINKKKDPEELSKELMKPFTDNKILVNIIKKLCRTFNIDFNDFWITIIYKMNNQRIENESQESLLDFLIANIETINNDIKDKYDEKVIKELDKLLNYKVFKLQTKFSLITMKDINNTIKLLNCIENNIDWIHTIKYDTASSYLLESSSDTTNINNHETIMDILETTSNDYNVNFRLEYLGKQI